MGRMKRKAWKKDERQVDHIDFDVLDDQEITHDSEEYQARANEWEMSLKVWRPFSPLLLLYNINDACDFLLE